VLTRNADFRNPTKGWAIRWHRLRTALPAGVVILFALAWVGVVFICVPISINADLRHATPRRAIGIVEGLVYVPVSQGFPDPPRMVSLRWHGESAVGYTHTPVRKGQRVLVTYRVGRSKRVYVERVEPSP
jgi:hypothetical protein